MFKNNHKIIYYLVSCGVILLLLFGVTFVMVMVWNICIVISILLGSWFDVLLYYYGCYVLLCLLVSLLWFDVLLWLLWYLYFVTVMVWCSIMLNMVVLFSNGYGLIFYLLLERSMMVVYGSYVSLCLLWLFCFVMVMVWCFIDYSRNYWLGLQYYLHWLFTQLLALFVVFSLPWF